MTAPLEVWAVLFAGVILPMTCVIVGIEASSRGEWPRLPSREAWAQAAVEAREWIADELDDDRDKWRDATARDYVGACIEMFLVFGLFWRTAAHLGNYLSYKPDASPRVKLSLQLAPGVDEEMPARADLSGRGLAFGLGLGMWELAPFGGSPVADVLIAANIGVLLLDPAAFGVHQLKMRLRNNSSRQGEQTECPQ